MARHQRAFSLIQESARFNPPGGSVNVVAQKEAQAVAENDAAMKSAVEKGDLLLTRPRCARFRIKEVVGTPSIVLKSSRNPQRCEERECKCSLHFTGVAHLPRNSSKDMHAV